MELTTENYHPDLRGLEDEGLEWTHRPQFERAMKAFCAEAVAFHTGRRLASMGMGRTIGWATATLISYFHGARPTGVTTSELTRLCDAGGLAGRKAVTSAINALLNAGLVVETTCAEDRRAKSLRPTEKLTDLHHSFLVSRLKALEIIQPLGRPADEAGRDPHALFAFLAGNVEAFARSKFKLYDRFPEVRALMDRWGGYRILLFLLLRAEAEPSGEVATGASASDLSIRFSISRAQVRKLMKFASENGWVTFSGASNPIRLNSEFYNRMRHWIGVELVWSWRLYPKDLDQAGDALRPRRDEADLSPLRALRS